MSLSCPSFGPLHPARIQIYFLMKVTIFRTPYSGYNLPSQSAIQKLSISTTRYRTIFLKWLPQGLVFSGQESKIWALLALNRRFWGPQKCRNKWHLIWRGCLFSLRWSKKKMTQKKPHFPAPPILKMDPSHLLSLVSWYHLI